MDNSTIKKTIVVYSGRFQPFHKGHYATYQKLTSKFGADNVFIGTSDKTDGGKSPFNFNEKREIMTKMFGIPSNKIVQVTNPYAPKEILSKYDPSTTAYITAVGEKDSSRLSGKYFEPYKGTVSKGYDVVGYVYPVPAEPDAISGTDVRKWLSADEAESKKMFDKIYPKWDPTIFKLITSKLKMMEGLVYPGHSGVFGEDDDDGVDDIEELVLEVDSFIEAYFNEDITMDVDKGDTVFMGKYKNKPVKVTDIGTDDHNMPTINGKKAATFRTTPKQNIFNTDEMSQSQLKTVEKYADSQLNPIDIEFTHHFFDRVNDPRNGKEISEPELIGFFKRLSKNKKQFIDFLQKYSQIVVKDRSSDINIPFINMANKAIAKTVMRKGNFMTSDPTLVTENTEKVKPIAEFIKYTKQRLELKQFPKVRLVTDGEFAKELKAFGGYDPETDEIHIYVKGRNPVDVIRTLAHELVHLKQKEDGRIGGVEDGATGSDIENEANAAAGILMREFGKVNPTIYESIHRTTLLVEGGAYGHMNHPFDVSMNLTFGDLKNIINNALDGSLGVVREKCIAGDSLIHTENNGKLPISTFVDENIDDKVLAYNSDTNSNEYMQVMDKFNNDYSDEWLRIELEDGKYIEVTPNHRMFVEGIGYMRADELVEGMDFKIIQ